MHATGRSAAKVRMVLRASLGLTLGYVLLTLVSGLRSHSLALLSEAGHNLSDLLALALSLAAVHLQAQPATPERTYGYRRAGVLAAFVNALALVGIAIWLGVAAVERLAAPVAVVPRVMVLVAAVGVVMNGTIAAMLWRASRDVNIRSVFLHMAGDTLSTAAVIAGGLGIWWTGMYWIDPALSLVIAAMVMWSAVDVVRETTHILLEGTPRAVRLGEVRATMLGVDGVLEVHDLHVWSLDTHAHALSSHITVADAPVSTSGAIVVRVRQVLSERFGIHHTTIQAETSGCTTDHGCTSPITESGEHEHHHHH
jgi:cobalt-zinc-cadmium efflux system protein